MHTASNNPGSGPLVRFYRGAEPDSSGRFIGDIRKWDYERLEHTHDYIQWLFPTRNRSRYNSSAPTLDEEQIRDFHYDDRLQAEMIASFKQMLDFYGFILREDNGCLSVERSPNWETRRGNWLTPENHNFLRITRILTSMRILGLGGHSRALLVALEALYKDYPGVIGNRTIGFWRSAAG
jgi:hypothetical protein